MSQIRVNAVTDETGGNTATINSMTPTADSLQGFRNRIINGDMRIDQRNNGAAVTIISAYTLDRWQFIEDTDGAASIQQVSDAPSGFNNSAKVTVTTADASIGASQFVALFQPIEGFNWADLGYGAAGAKTATLSFWTKSSLTGTFSGAIENSDGSRSYIFSYTISSANTWEYKTVTIDGDTSGTWAGSTNGLGVRVLFTLTAGATFQGPPGSWGATRLGATGTTQLMSTLSATWQVTGVQLEAGSVATPFERRPFGAELALCQRYLPAYNGVGNMSSGCCFPSSGTVGRPIFVFPVTARVPPTGVSTPDVSLLRITDDFAIDATPSALGGILNASISGASVDFTIAGATGGRSGRLYSTSASGQLLFTGCEL